MRYGTSALLLCVAIALGAASTALAQVVERSGNVYHKAVCPGPAGPGAARCHAHVVTDRGGNPIANATRNGTPSGYGPSTLQAAYGVVQGKQTTTPNGPIIAIVDAYGYGNAEADLGTYRAQFGLPACTTSNGCFKKVNEHGQQGSYPNNNTGWDQEQALDLDMVSAICPNCRILLVEASSASFANLGTAENTAASFAWPGGSTAHAISNSYGGNESSADLSIDNAYYNHPGIAITVSTGDSGYGAEYPATSPHVTAVGGTTLVMNGSTRVSETAWSGGGSGCSSVFPEPSWQNPVTGTLCGYRMEADTSAVADPNTGVSVYGPASGRFSAWLVFGGTSVAAPLTAGIYGLNGGATNFGSDPYGSHSALRDITSGSNGNCASYFCNAGAGYDGPTGLGTPIGDGAF